MSEKLPIALDLFVVYRSSDNTALIALESRDEALMFVADHLAEHKDMYVAVYRFAHFLPDLLPLYSPPEKFAETLAGFLGWPFKPAKPQPCN